MRKVLALLTHLRPMAADPDAVEFERRQELTRRRLHEILTERIEAKDNAQREALARIGALGTDADVIGRRPPDARG